MKSIDELGISPAPWTYTEADDMYHAGVDDKDEDGVCETYICVGSPEVETANARLIAAAPDLYEALRMFIELCESYGCDKKCEDCICAEQPCIIKARAALAKAGGEVR